MVLVDLDDLATHAARNLPQLAFLVSRGLVQGGHSQIDSCSAHRFSPSRLEAQTTIFRVRIISLFFAREIARLKPRVLLAFWRAIFGGFIHTPEATHHGGMWELAGALPGLLEGLNVRCRVRSRTVEVGISAKRSRQICALDRSALWAR